MRDVRRVDRLSVFSGQRRFLSSAVGRETTETPSSNDVAELILQQKSAALVLQTFRWALRLPSFAPTPTLYRAVVRSLLSFRRLDSAIEVLSELPSPPDEATLVTLFRSLGHNCMTRRALQLLDELPARFHLLSPPSVKVLNSVLDILVKDNIDLARNFFRKKMKGRGDEYTFGILMKGLCRTNRIAEGFKLLTLMKLSYSKPNPVIYNTLIHALCRNGNVGKARSLMAEMEHPSEVTFNILISAYCNEGNLVQALVMLEKSFDFGLVPDAITVTKIVGVLCSHDRAMEAVEILERVEKKGGIVDAVAYNALIKGFCDMVKPEVGRRVMREMERKGCLPNLQTYDTLILGFCNSEKMDSAMDIFREMEMDGIRPGFFTYDTLIRGHCLTGRVRDGLKLLDVIEERSVGKENKVAPYNSILYGFYKEGRTEEAKGFLITRMKSFPRVTERSLRIFGFCSESRISEAMLVYDEMVKEGDLPSVLVYDGLIQGLSEHGQVSDAFDVMNVMVDKGLFPISSTFNALIRGFCRVGKFRSASKLIEEMGSRKCLPGADSYSPLVCGLCKNGEFVKACGFVVQMVERGLIPGHCIWSCLLLSGNLFKETESVVQISEVLSNCFIDE